VTGGLTRRRLLAGGAGAAAVAAAGGGLAVGSRAEDAESDAPHTGRIAFHGAHQAGITTAAQDRLHFAAFDLTTRRVDDVRLLLRSWTAAAASLALGRPVPGRDDVGLAPPDDTGEAYDLPPSRLTVTFGFGPGLFDERFGLADRRPAALRELPRLPGDELEPGRCGGDLAVQACADDPQVAFHAVRNLARLARGTAVMRWSQLGFGRTSTTTRAQSTPRNLMGFKDGTNNLRAEDREALDEHVWVREGDQPWLEGGTYLVARRIRMLIESWDRASLDDQEQTIGRHKRSGAPLGADREHDPVRLGALPATAHVRLAAPAANGGVRLLRRGYSFTDGMDADLGQLDAGLFFLSFQNDPARFVRVQRALATDGLNEYVRHTGSAVFAVPPGVPRGGYVGEGLT
jgi:deferrochelatase/peroxidase EfeB